MQSDRMTIDALNQFLEDGKKVAQTRRQGGFYGEFEVVDRSLLLAWKSKILTYLRSTSLVIPDIIETIEKTDKEYYSSYETIKNNVLSLIDLLEKNYISGSKKDQINYDAIFERIFSRFHKVARQLRTRHDNRETLTIKDEYDVQDLLHALLLIYFDDVRSEEWTPSYAGGSVRADFLLKDCKTFIEVKKTRDSLTAKKLGEELIIDCEKYKNHPDCEKLYCFIYDPEGLLGNPAGIKNDLENAHKDFLKVFIKPE